jgi:hypothetical protein
MWIKFAFLLYPKSGANAKRLKRHWIFFNLILIFARKAAERAGRKYNINLMQKH